MDSNSCASNSWRHTRSPSQTSSSALYIELVHFLYDILENNKSILQFSLQILTATIPYPFDILPGNMISFITWGVFNIYICLSAASSISLLPRSSNGATPASAPTAVSTGPSSSSIPEDINTTELGNPSNPAWIGKLINVTNGLATSFEDVETLPINGNATTASDRWRRLQRLNLLFPGIYWDRAYPDDQSESCTFEQLNILEMATRVAVRLSHYSPPNTEDAAFMKYFVTDGRVSGQWSSGKNRGQYLNLISNEALYKNHWAR